MRAEILGYVATSSLVVASLAACGDSTTATGAGGSTSATGGTTTASASSSTVTASASSGSTSSAGTTSSSTGAGGGPVIGAAPHTLVYAGTIVGIDERKTTADVVTGISLDSYVVSADERPELGTNQVVDASGDAFVVIGRWAGGTTAGKFYQAGNMGLLDFPANGGFHYAIGNASAPIPSSGAATYALASTTSATVSDGSLQPGTITGSLGAILAGSNSKVGFSITLDVPGDAMYTVATTGGSANPMTSQISIDPTIEGAFGGSFPMSGGGACQGAPTCFASVFGFFAGPNAERAALVVHVFTGGGGSPKSVSGALVFSH